jgi:hypothetical protein
MEELRARVLEAARREPSPARGAVLRRRAMWIAGAAAVSVLVFAAVGGPRPGPRPLSLILWTALGSAALAAGALWSAGGRGGSMVGRPRAWLWAVAVSTPLALLAWKVGCSVGDAQMMAPWPGRVGFRCLGLSLAMAATPLAALLAARKNGDPVHPRSAGLALGVAAGAAAWVLVDLWCPVAHPRHLLIGHVLPLVLLAAAGAWLGGRWLSMRPR